jgi:hypothetical protein
VSVFDHVFWLGGVSFHAWTFVVLLVGIAADLCVRGLRPTDLVHAAALTLFSVHFYELVHGLAEWLFVGFLSPSVYTMNLGYSVGAWAIMTAIDKTNRQFVKVSVAGMGLLFLLILFSMGVLGFFTSGYPKTALWAASKLAASALSFTAFTLKEVRG